MRTRQNETKWLEIVKFTDEPDQRYLLDHGTADWLLDQINEPDLSYPQLICCIGAAQKPISLPDFIPEIPATSSKRRSRNASIHLRAGDQWCTSTNPILLADIDVKASNVRCTQRSAYRSKRIWPIVDWDLTDRIIQCPIVLPFTDVVCVFADDFEVNPRDGLKAALRELERLPFFSELDTGTPSIITPHIFFITSAQATPESHCEKIRHNCTFIQPSTTVSLEWLIKEQLARKEAFRKATQHSISAINLPCFLQKAIQHVAKTRDHCFNIIKGSKAVPANLQSLLGDFIKLTEQHNINAKLTRRVIASTLIHHAYYPPSHRKLFLGRLR